MKDSQIQDLAKKSARLKVEAADIDAQIEKLRAELVDFVRWRPDINETYIAIMNSLGGTVSMCCQDSDGDRYRIATGNRAPDTEEGREYLRQREEKAKYRQRYLEACNCRPDQARRVLIVENGEVSTRYEVHNNGVHGFVTHKEAMAFAASEDRDFLKKMLTEGFL